MTILDLNCDSMIAAFENAPNKCFFGLDRGGSHSFTIPVIVKNDLIELFGLKDGFLQTEIFFKVGARLYPAEIRLGRVLNIRPHRLHDRKKTDVVKFQWARFESTKSMFREKLESVRCGVLEGGINSTNVVHFRYLGESTFEISFIRKN